MKQTKLTLFLFAFAIVLTAVAARTPTARAEPIDKQTSYYWYDVNWSWLGRRTTLATEMMNTGYDESISNPKTLQEKGLSSSNVSVDGNGYPWPLTTTAEKVLYSHP